jgi:hypothetical protein
MIFRLKSSLGLLLSAFKTKSKVHKFGGVHGLAILVKNSISDYVTVLEETTSNCVLWLHIKQEVCGREVIISGVYIPGECSYLYEASQFDDITDDIVSLQAKVDALIALLGDFNARTGLLDDFMEIEDKVELVCDVDEELCTKNDMLESIGIVTDVFNEDKRVNNNGRNLIELCKCFDLKIVNGRFGGDKGVGQFTCLTPNVSLVMLLLHYFTSNRDF